MVIDWIVDRRHRLAVFTRRIILDRRALDGLANAIAGDQLAEDRIAEVEESVVSADAVPPVVTVSSGP